MSLRFTLGIEEEFQMVDRHTGQLSSHILTMLEKGTAQFGDKIKAEMLQSAVELVSGICPNILAARLELQQTRAMLLKLAEQEGLSLISAGTHPAGSWIEQRATPNVLPRYFVEENKWQAMRYGLDGEITDFVHGRSTPMRDAINDMLDFVDDVLDDLGSRREIHYLRRLLEDPRGTGADRQIAVYKQTGSLEAVIRYLIEQTALGVGVEPGQSSASLYPFTCPPRAAL